MKCSKCSRNFVEGEGLETVTGFVCWACSVADEVAKKLTQSETLEIDEEAEMWASLSTTELVTCGLIDDATLAEMLTPFDSEVLPAVA